MKNAFLIQLFLAGLGSTFFIGNEFQAAGEEALPKSKSFKSYLDGFEKASLPLQIGLEDFHVVLSEEISRSAPAGAKEISSRFEEFVPEVASARYSRMGPDDIYYHEMLVSNDAFTAVVYKGSHPYSMAGVNYYVLATYDNDGEMISNVNVGSCWSPENYSETTIDKDLNVVVTRYETVWKEDVYEKGFKNNEITGREVLSTETFSLDDHGIVYNGENEALLESDKPSFLQLKKPKKSPEKELNEEEPIEMDATLKAMLEKS